MLGLGVTRYGAWRYSGAASVRCVEISYVPTNLLATLLLER